MVGDADASSAGKSSDLFVFAMLLDLLDILVCSDTNHSISNLCSIDFVCILYVLILCMSVWQASRRDYKQVGYSHVCSMRI